jgi:transposase InsO family protein
MAHSKDSLWSVDLFRCESILLHSYWVLVVMDIFTRRIVGFGIARDSIDGVTVCRTFNHAVAGHLAPVA